MELHPQVDVLLASQEKLESWSLWPLDGLLLNPRMQTGNWWWQKKHKVHQIWTISSHIRTLMSWSRFLFVLISSDPSETTTVGDVEMEEFYFCACFNLVEISRVQSLHERKLNQNHCRWCGVPLAAAAAEGMPILTGPACLFVLPAKNNQQMRGWRIEEVSCLDVIVLYCLSPWKWRKQSISQNMTNSTDAVSLLEASVQPRICVLDPPGISFAVLAKHRSQISYCKRPLWCIYSVIYSVYIYIYTLLYIVYI